MSHPTDDVGEFIVNDSLRVQGDFVANNSVESGRPGRVRVESCRIDRSGNISLAGACNHWIQSVTRRSVGEYLVNIRSGVFSSIPTCVSNSIITFNICNSNSRGTTLLSIDCRSLAGALRDSNSDFICMALTQ